MPFYPPNPGRRPFYPPNPRRRPFYPPTPGRRPFPPGNIQRNWRANRIERQPHPFLNPTQGQQAPTSGLQGLQTVMGHVGNVTNGINMLRQMGSLMKFF
ncbi:hypothetical protein KM885_06575 [Oceanobacillus caeni]|uniref:hypothetical protein n=1 Tax=Oceanobacillus caeni TaxID=405946 RepID=UPI001C22A75C|nr:hypothetical protein [Oceanobacillus caeni]MBU8790456.1 hypothetical protein [Oceanobacillus caeni]